MTPAAPRDALAWAPPVTVAAFVVPIGAGLAGTLLPAFGYLPAIGGTAFRLDAWRTLFAHPGIATSIALTVGTGVGTTLLAVLLAFGFCAFVHDRPLARRVEIGRAHV
jgi:putative thiamine transport system permease protein